MKLVVDASVALKWYLNHREAEQDVERAAAVGRAIEKPNARLFSPTHWVLEVVSVLARIEPELAEVAIRELADIGPTIVNGSNVISRAARMASDLKRHMFDTMYHAVAIECGAQLVTADLQYFNSARHLGHIISLPRFEPT
jgi:predicted nucleic acid-binding protein